MALANVATLLTRWGYRTLMIDWDLETPGGIAHYFEGSITSDKVPSKDGILELLFSAKDIKRAVGVDVDEELDDQSLDDEVRWEELVLPLELKLGDSPEGELGLLSAGQSGLPDYFNKLHTFDVRDFYSKGGAAYIERLRNQWKEKYDFVLIDSRSGITPFASVCTIQLPDILVLLLQCDDRDLAGGINVAKHVSVARRSMPFDRLELLTIPIPARFDADDSPTGYDYEQRWLARFEWAVADFYKPWLPKSFPKQEMLKYTRIPYDAKSLVDDERLPTLRKHLPEPTEISKAYERIAALLANDLHRANRLRDDRSGFLSDVWKNFSVPRVLNQHEEWLRTKRVYGQRANLTDRDCSNLNLPHAWLAEGVFVNTKFKSTNLLGANVVRANFSGANLEGAILKELKGAQANFRNASLSNAKLAKADLRGADLQSARLNNADLKDAKLYRATLKKAVLEGATGLTPAQFKAADLSYATLPKGLDEFGRLREVQSQSRRARMIFFSLGILCVYSAVVLFKIDHLALFNNESLGPLGGGISAMWFIASAPAILLMLYLLFLIVVQQLWNNLIELPATFPDGLTLDEKISDWFTAAVAYPYLAAKVRSASKWRRITLSLITRFLIPLTQLLFCLKIVPLRNLPFLVFQGLLVAVTIALGWSFRGRGTKTLRANNTGEHWQTEATAKFDELEMAA